MVVNFLLKSLKQFEEIYMLFSKAQQTFYRTIQFTKKKSKKKLCTNTQFKEITIKKSLKY